MFAEVLEKINEYKYIIIHRHISPDPDALGSQIGLKLLIEQNFPDKEVKVVGQQEETLAWLGSMQQVADIEYGGALVIVVDTANRNRIDDSRYKKGSCLVKIDHHPIVDEYGDVAVVDTSAASTCEMIVRLADEAGWEMPIEVARLLYAGVISDSGRFLYDTITSHTFEVARRLFEYGIDISEIYANLYRKPMNVIRAQAYVLNNFEVTENGVAHFRLSRAKQAEFGLTTGTRSQLVDVLSGVYGVKVRVCFFEQDGKQIRANIRSVGPVINEVAGRFNGGGHPKASGAMLNSWEMVEDLIKELDTLCAE